MRVIPTVGRWLLLFMCSATAAASASGSTSGAEASLRHLLQAPTPIDVSLEAGAGNPAQGRLVVNIPDGQGGVTKGTVCQSLFSSDNDNVAEVVCRQLGYSGKFFSTEDSSYGASDLPMLMYNLKCQGTETNIKDCVWDVNAECQGKAAPIEKKAYELGIQCEGGKGNISVALADGGGNPAQGRLQVTVPDGKGGFQTGTVCQSLFSSSNDNVAEVVCRELGYNGQFASSKDSSYGPSNLPMLMYALTCQGTEANIGGCVWTTVSECNGQTAPIRIREYELGIQCIPDPTLPPVIAPGPGPSGGPSIAPAAPDTLPPAVVPTPPPVVDPAPSPAPVPSPEVVTPTPSPAVVVSSPSPAVVPASPPPTAGAMSLSKGGLSAVMGAITVLYWFLV